MLKYVILNILLYNITFCGSAAPADNVEPTVPLGKLNQFIHQYPAGFLSQVKNPLQICH